MKKTIISFWMLFVAIAFSQEKKITPILLSTQQLVVDEFITMDSFGYLYYIKGNVFYKQKENELFQKHIELIEFEQTLFKTLNEKYGDGDYDPITGVFSPKSIENNVEEL